MRARKRRRPRDNDDMMIESIASFPLNPQKETEIQPEPLHSFELLSIHTRSQLPRAQSELPPPSHAASPHNNDVIVVQHSCLLIPVAVAAWWYWVKRKARAAMSGLLHHSSHPNGNDDDDSKRDVPDDFSTWDEVVENESQDRSVRFVRWIKCHDLYNSSSSQQKASVHQASRRTLRLLSSNLADEFINEDDSIASVKHQDEGGWQCLEDAHGIELCAAASEDYIEMGELQRKQWSPQIV